MGVWENFARRCKAKAGGYALKTAFNGPRENKSLVKTRNYRYAAADIEMD
jgi:hypothetical protein